MATSPSARQNTDAFMNLYKKTKAPPVRDFLMTAYQTFPQLFGVAGNATLVIPAEVLDEIKASTPATSPGMRRGGRPRKSVEESAQATS